MKKTLIFTSIFTIVSGTLTAQVADADTEKALRTKTTADTVYGWKFSGLTSLNIANTYLANWAAGGENSLGMEGNAALFANLRKPKFVWENSAAAALGGVRQGKISSKTNDRLAFNSKYGQRAYKDFFYAGLVDFRTQMLEGKKYTSDTTYNIISRFFAPANLIAAIGMDYNPNANLSLFVSPLSARLTFVADSALSSIGAFDVDPGKYFLFEYGGYTRFMFQKSNWNWEILKNVIFVTKLDVFFNYNLRGDNPFLDKVKCNTKVNWDNQLMFKVNKHLTFMFSNQYIYDHSVKLTDNPNQYRQIIAFGFAYKF
ncbi:MAG: DUF3078 domain-containing protein [Bacteroidetes bacterium]|nr:DUF3078 domain-containing protein [Bacteroidota bacterium]